MTEKEQFEYVGTLCMAAHRLGIAGRWNGEAFDFFDPQTRVLIHEEPANHRKNTLFNACKKLNEYLNQ